VPIAQLRTTAVQRFLGQRPRLVVLALVLQQRGEVVDRDERVRVPIAQLRTTAAQRFLEQRPRLVVLALGLQQRGEVADRRQRVRVPIAQLRTTAAQRCLVVPDRRLDILRLVAAQAIAVRVAQVHLRPRKGHRRIAHSGREAHNERQEAFAPH